MADEDREAFERAMSDAPPQEQSAPEPQAPQPEAEAAAPEPKADATGRLHGDRGKFVPKTPQEAVPTQQPAQAAPVAEREPERIPLAEHLNLRERAQKAEQRAEEFERQLQAFRRQMEKPPEPPKPAPDIFEDPQGFVGSMRQEFQSTLRQTVTNLSFENAHDQHGEAFEAAYNSLLREGERGNTQPVQSILGASNPGKALMKWHKNQTLLEKTGGDFEKFTAEYSEKLLDDEAFLTRAIERVRARQNGQPPNGQRPAPVVQMPPSLNRIASAAPAADGDHDMGDAAIFRRSMSR